MMQTLETISQDKEKFILYVKYKRSWWRDNAKNHTINSHRINLVFPK